MVVKLARRVMASKRLQCWKAYFPIVVKLAGRSMEAKLQFEKAYSPIVVKLAGRSMEIKLSQDTKADGPIVVTLAGRIMEVKLMHRPKALSPIVVTGPLKVMMYFWRASLYSSLTKVASKVEILCSIGPSEEVYQIWLGSGAVSSSGVRPAVLNGTL